MDVRHQQGSHNSDASPTVVKRRSRKAYMPLRIGIVAFYLLSFVGAAYYRSMAASGDVDVSTFGRKLMAGGGGTCDASSAFYVGVAGESSAKWGVFFVEVLAIIYCFVGLAIVCDDYFVSALEVISEKLKLSHEVAGATFMAAGSSAPELFTSLSAVIVGGLSGAEGGNSTGIGTIVGSSIFNYTIVIGITILASPTRLNLRWLPLVRDTVFYLAITIQLVVYFEYWTPGFITLVEAAILFSFYILYILYMRFDKKISKALKQYVPPEGEEDEEVTKPISKELEVPAVSARPESGSSKLTTKNIDVETGKVDSSETSVPPPRYGAFESENNDKAPSTDEETGSATPRPRVKSNQVAALEAGKAGSVTPSPATSQDGDEARKGGDDDDDEPESIYAFPKKHGERARYILSFPLVFLFHYTVPDCRKKKLVRFYPATFILSILWIAALSFVMVECATYVGCFLQVPAIIMGLTVLAAGTSIPDSLSSISVAKSGKGSMAVANSLGSNVFDGVVGLPVPWMIGIAAFQKAIPVSALGLWIYIIIDFAILFALLLMCAITKFRPGKVVGAMLFLLYAGWTIFGILTGMPENAPIICLGVRDNASMPCEDPTIVSAAAILNQSLFY